jgi:Uma2 family endonuclease
MALITHRVPTTARHGKVEYPDSDGKPMAETDVHRNLMVSLITALRWRYRDEPLVYVSGNLLFYYVEGDPRKCTAPDCFVVKGVPGHDRRTYLLWEEGVAPCVVIEVTSRSTRRQDTREKRELYARLGIREYFLFDPLEEYLRPSMQGLRLAGGEYVEISPEPDGSLTSTQLGLKLSRAGSRLRLWDPVTGAEVMDDQRRAETEQRRAEVEGRRAETEQRRAETAEAELARLRALLRQDDQSSPVP